MEPPVLNVTENADPDPEAELIDNPDRTRSWTAEEQDRFLATGEEPPED